ncbi:MAG: hypothetical protein WCT14_20510, partial [Treponemataceae bacterium]
MTATKSTQHHRAIAALGVLSVVGMMALALIGCSNPLAKEAQAIRAEAASPRFVLSDAAAVVVSANGTVNFPATSVGGNYDLSLTIKNSGNSELTIDLTGIVITMGSGTEPDTFSVKTPPPATVATGGSATLELRFSPIGTLGEKTATVSIPTNDVTNPKFTFTVKGSGVTGSKDITAFAFVSPAATGLISGTSIGVNVPVGTNTALLVANFATTGVSVTVNGIPQTSGVTTVDFSHGSVDYVVKAADATTKTYTVTVTVAATPPVLTATPAISAITWTTASGAGNILSDGGAAIPAGSRGICWNITGNPTIADSLQADVGGGTGGFTCALSGLLPGMYYYVRAYATNSAGTDYSPQVGFSTTAATAPTTTAVSD